MRLAPATSEAQHTPLPLHASNAADSSSPVNVTCLQAAYDRSNESPDPIWSAGTGGLGAGPSYSLLLDDTGKPGLAGGPGWA